MVNESKAWWNDIRWQICMNSLKLWTRNISVTQAIRHFDVVKRQTDIIKRQNDVILTSNNVILPSNDVIDVKNDVCLLPGIC